MAMRQMTVDVDDDLRDRLARWAREEGRPIANLVRRIATTAVEQHERARGAAGAAQDSAAERVA